jgi:transketolase
LNEDAHKLAAMRKEIFLTGYSASIAHLASAYSIVEMLYALYMKGVLRHDPKNPLWPGRDRLILSKGHGSLALYTALQMAGFFDLATLRSFSKPGSALGGEPCTPRIPGVEASTGSLGHGLSIGVGMALAHKIDGSDSKTYVILGDGECEEGSIWEAVMAAAAFKLENLVVLLDNNRIQKMGPVQSIMGIDDWRTRWEAFGWSADPVDGHDVDALCRALTTPAAPGRPRVVIANTVKGKGVSIMENQPSWHWKLPNRRELKTIVQELSITGEELEQCKKPT